MPRCHGRQRRRGRRRHLRPAGRRAATACRRRARRCRCLTRIFRAHAATAPSALMDRAATLFPALAPRPRDPLLERHRRLAARPPPGDRPEPDDARPDSRLRLFRRRLPDRARRSARSLAELFATAAAATPIEAFSITRFAQPLIRCRERLVQHQPGRSTQGNFRMTIHSQTCLAGRRRACSLAAPPRPARRDQDALHRHERRQHGAHVHASTCSRRSRRSTTSRWWWCRAPRSDILAKAQASKEKPQMHVMFLDDGVMVRAIAMGLCQKLKPTAPELTDLYPAAHMAQGRHGRRRERGHDGPRLQQEDVRREGLGRAHLVDGFGRPEVQGQGGVPVDVGLDASGCTAS